MGERQLYVRHLLSLIEAKRVCGCPEVTPQDLLKAIQQV